MESHGKLIQSRRYELLVQKDGKTQYEGKSITVPWSLLLYVPGCTRHLRNQIYFFLRRGKWKNPQPEVSLSSVIAIIITPTDTRRLCGLQAQHLFRTVIVTFGSSCSRRAPTCPVPRKSRLYHRHFVTCSHSNTRWSITWHGQLPVARHSTAMNESPSSIPCSYLTYAHSSDVTYGPLVGWVSKTGPAVIKRTQWHPRC